MAVTLALVGNPNVGKTAVFNLLTGLTHSTGNYPGTTVEKKHGRLAVPSGCEIEIVDLPGTYSLAARSPDEMIVADVLLGQQQGEVVPDGLLVVLDASNLERNLYLCSQLLELGKPLILVLNMIDIARRRGVTVKHDVLSARLGVPVVSMSANTGEGLESLHAALEDLAKGQVAAPDVECNFSCAFCDAVKTLVTHVNAHADRLGHPLQRVEAIRILIDQDGYAEARLLKRVGAEVAPLLARLREDAQAAGAALPMQEARVRYAWIKQHMDECVTRPAVRAKTRSERIDDVVTHPLYGGVVFFVLMMLIFQAIYAWAGPLMDLIDGSIGTVGGLVGGFLPEGMLQSLVVDGIFAGVGGVLVFLPQILVLSLLIALLEDCGYMARAAFLMDRLLSWCGLSGQSFIPMMSSFACAIPGIMATRTIPNRMDRLTTILVAPLMSCSARLPVYTIMIAAFIPAHNLFGGLVGLQGLTLFAMYCIGPVVAVPIAWLLKRFVFKSQKPPFILEMPSYKVPQARTVALKVYRDGFAFVMRAGTLIFAVTVVVWALAYFPRAASIGAEFEAQRGAVAQQGLAAEQQDEALATIDLEESGAYLRDSFLGRAGHLVEPIFQPMGWDWRIATAVIASFPAREIVIANLSTLFNLGADTDENSSTLSETLRDATRPDGRHLFNLAVALSLMVFFALCSQCGATLVTMRRETGQWRWPAFAFAYMTGLAYVAAVLVYQAVQALGGAA